jgi:DNA-directed RNA polymerase specialized sigma24 family protein
VRIFNSNRAIPENAAVTDGTSEDVSALARQYGPTVFRAAWRILGNRAACEDVQQQLFLRLIEAPPRAVQSWAAYLTASATRLAIDHLRRQHRWRLLAPLWQADEPTGALDSEGGQEILELFRRLHSDGQTILMVTHSPDVAAGASRVVLMRDGRIVDGDGAGSGVAEPTMSGEAMP